MHATGPPGWCMQCAPLSQIGMWSCGAGTGAPFEKKCCLPGDDEILMRMAPAFAGRRTRWLPGAVPKGVCENAKAGETVAWGTWAACVA